MVKKKRKTNEVQEANVIIVKRKGNRRGEGLTGHIRELNQMSDGQLPAGRKKTRRFVTPGSGHDRSEMGRAEKKKGGKERERKKTQQRRKGSRREEGSKSNLTISGHSMRKNQKMGDLSNQSVGRYEGTDSKGEGERPDVKGRERGKGN